MPARLSPWALPAAVATGVLLAALDGGSYALDSRHTLAIVVWWTLAIALTLGLVPRERIPPVAWGALALLAAFAAWTGLSTMWAESEELAWEELGRSALFVGIAAGAVLVGRRGTAARWADGLALGIAAVVAVALASRCFQGLFPDDDLRTFIATSAHRLSYPLNYWNGLAILAGIGVPLALAPAEAARRFGAVGLAFVPAAAATIFLASSRGGTAVAVIGALAFAVLSRRPWRALAALAVGAAGSAVAVAVLVARPELVDEPFEAEAVGQGRSAAVLLVLVCAATATAFALADRLHWRAPGRKASYGLVLLAAVAFAAGAAAANPQERWERFTRAPEAGSLDAPVAGHLLSGSSSGRWQQWSAALDQFREHPVLGGGAGSYAAWWSVHGAVPGVTSEAHSLYLETLGELGVLGFALVTAALALALVAGVRRGPEAAAPTAAFAAYVAAAGFDWVWELTVVSLVGIALLGLLVGPTTAGDVPMPPRPWKSATRAALAIVALVVVAIEAVPLARELALRRSQDAAAEGRTVDAVDAALRAHRIEPWASSPPLQLALVYEAAGRPDVARGWLEEALERDRSDWRIWLTAARVETRAGDFDAARRALACAVALNPHSPLFSSVKEGVTVDRGSC